jgi:hypothetical protein
MMRQGVNRTRLISTATGTSISDTSSGVLVDGRGWIGGEIFDGALNLLPDIAG